jgi:uncharacterized membrane protein
MPSAPSRHVTCPLCGEHHPRAACVRVANVRHSLATFIEARHREKWSEDAALCRRCLNTERTAYLREEFARERGELTALEAEISRKAVEHGAIARHWEQEFQRTLTLGERMADGVARVGGSWRFVIGFGAVLFVWIAVNSLVLAQRAFDPYPYILLNLALSCLAAIQAPIIMMSQNRSAARDRQQADEDYKINLKAEFEIAALHEKVDHLMHVQAERMQEMNETLLEFSRELAEREPGRAPESGRPGPTG